jgi:hypothetical protein
MNFSQLRKSETRSSPKSVPVEARAALIVAVALVFGLALGDECRASTGSSSSSWNDQPAWAVPTNNDNPNPAPRNRARAQDRYRNDVSPFSPGSNNLAIDVGQVFLMGDLGNKYDDSIGAQLHYTYGVSDLFGFDSSFGYSGHSDGQFSMTSLLTGLRMNLSWYDKVIPYLVFGLGFYRPSYQEKGVASGPGQPVPTTTLSPVLFGVHVGPGVDLELTKQLYFGASLTFHDVFGSSKNDVTGLQQDVGGTYASFLLHVGYTF